ncbi:MAG: hypothetical protein AAF074_07440 [Pseudomonadota bacterium]
MAETTEAPMQAPMQTPVQAPMQAPRRAPGGPIGVALERALGKELIAGRELARRDPVYEPKRDKRGEVGWTMAIFWGWLAYAALTFWTAGFDAGRTMVPIPFLLAAGVGTWFLAEWLVRKRGMIWPGSMLGLLGPVSFALAFSLSTPELRALPGLEYITVIYSGTTLGMLIYAWRFRLAGLISPIVTFSVISLFLFFKGSNPANWGQIEGFSPRGFLAAFIDKPESMAFFGTLAALAMIQARRLDLYGDWFALQAARPLHIIGAAIVGLVLGRVAEGLPTGLDTAVLLILFVAGFLWAMRIDRLPVMVAIWLAMARPLIATVVEPMGIAMDWRDWGYSISAVVALGLVLWARMRQPLFVPLGWTMQPRHIQRNWPERVIWPLPKDLSRI